MRENRHRVALRVEPNSLARDVIHNNRVQSLGGQLLARILEHVLRFRSESDDDLARLSPRQFGKNVRVRLQFQSHRPLALDLLLRLLFGAVIRDGSRHNDQVCFRQQPKRRLPHLRRRFHARDFYTPRGRNRHRPCNEQHACPAPHRSLSHRITHAPAGAVRQIAHRINLFPRRPRCDQYGTSREILRCTQRFQNRVDDRLVRSQSPRANHAAGQISAAGLDNANAAGAQCCHIGLRRGVLPHVDVHGWSYNCRGLGGEKCSGQEIRSQTAGKLGQNIGCRGNDHERINRLRHGNVFDRRIKIGLLGACAEKIGNDFLAGKRGKRQGPDKFLRRAGHDDLNSYAAVLQQAHNLRCLIRRNAAANAERNFHGGPAMDGACFERICPGA